MTRLHQIVLIGAFLPLCWLGMMAVHELGHVLGEVVTGGTVERVVLHPLTISRTDVSPNPRPLFVVWTGPMVGVLLPLTLLMAARAARWEKSYLIQFFAGFCFIANGVYIGVGSFAGIGDAGDMLRHGSPVWSLWAFGLAAFLLGVVFLEWPRPAFRAWYSGRQGRSWCRATPAPPLTCHFLLTTLGLWVCLRAAGGSFGLSTSRCSSMFRELGSPTRKKPRC